MCIGLEVAKGWFYKPSSLGLRVPVCNALLYFGSIEIANVPIDSIFWLRLFISL
jgi:hypothetical protein